MNVTLYKNKTRKPLSEYIDFVAKNTSIIVDALAPVQAYLAAIHEIESQKLFQLEKNKPENKDKLWTYGYKVYSQNEEDGIIAEIFKRIGIKNHTFIEFGVGTGNECNTAKLLVEGWRGLWMDTSGLSNQHLADLHSQHMSKLYKLQEQFKGKLKVKEAFITAENINDLLKETIEWNEIDLLGIDIDYNDYWVWKAITVIRPRVVVIEYNALFPPPISLIVPYDPKAVWNDESNYFVASLEAIAQLAYTKGYSLVGCNFTGINAFYVRNDLIKHNMFLTSFMAERHYEPVRYNVRQMLGHGSKVAPYQQV